MAAISLTQKRQQKHFFAVFRFCFRNYRKLGIVNFKYKMTGKSSIFKRLFETYNHRKICEHWIKFNGIIYDDSVFFLCKTNDTTRLVEEKKNELCSSQTLQKTLIESLSMPASGEAKKWAGAHTFSTFDRFNESLNFVICY